MSEDNAISVFCDLLGKIRNEYGTDIVFEPKRMRALLNDLNLQFKDEEKKFLFVISDS